MEPRPQTPGNPNTDDAGIPKAADPANLPLDPDAVGGTSRDDASAKPETSVEEQTRPFDPETTDGKPGEPDND